MRAKQEGFTLMEVLVAVIITGISITAFFQLFSSSMRLEMKGREKLSQAFEARQLFETLLLQDFKADDFDWEGEAGDVPWRLTMHPVDVADEDDDDTFNTDDDEVDIKIPKDLYALKLAYYERGLENPPLTFVLYREYSANELSEDFKKEHVGEPLESEDADQ